MANFSAPLILVLAAALLASTARADQNPPDTETAAAFKAANCSADFAKALADSEPFDLENGKTLYKVECWRSSYQVGSILMMTDSDGKTRQLTFTSWNGSKFEPALTLTDVDYVPQNRTLTSFWKGNSEAECGQIGMWLWNGSEFKLTGYWYKAKCDGYQLYARKRWRVR